MLGSSVLFMRFLAKSVLFTGLLVVAFATHLSAHDCIDYSVLIGVSEEESSSVISEVPA